MKGFNPYLNFDGNCREALDFYKKCFSGEIVSLQTFGDAPGIDPSQKDQVMHSVFQSGKIFFMASDSPGHVHRVGTNVTLNIDFDDASLQTKVFDQLAEGGKVTMPLQDTFWGARFGMVTDRFGINWMVNCELKK